MTIAVPFQDLAGKVAHRVIYQLAKLSLDNTSTSVALSALGLYQLNYCHPP
jgi:hypothetical protein